MFVCDKCGYNTTDSSNFKRHCNRKTPCSFKNTGGNATLFASNATLFDKNATMNISNPTNCVSNTIQDAENPIIQFSTIDDTHVMCMVCKKKLLKRSSKTHSCRGAPVNTCVFCKKQFNHSSNLAIHKKRCKQNPVNTVPVPENQEQQHTVVQNITNNNTTTINNNTVNNTVINVINIQFGNENIQELLLKAEHDERFLALSTKLREKQNIRIEIDALIASKDNYDSDRHYELVLQEKHKTDELFHVLMDLVYFNEDIPQNHTIRKTNKKSDMIEIRDNELWNPMPTNSVVKTILNPICKLAQGMADVPEDMFATKKYTKQNFNEIMYSKTQRGYLNEQRILQPYEKRQLDTRSSEWKAFSDDVYRSFTPFKGHDISDLKRETVLEQLQATAVKYELDDFCPDRDGEPKFQEILKRWTEFFKQ
jgi:hypothetical protein